MKPPTVKPLVLGVKRTALSLGLCAATLVAACATAFVTAGDALAADARRTVVLALTLEPAPGLDPTSGAAAAIGEVTHYNIFEGLTKIQQDGTIAPLLATSWTISPDQKTFSFKLRSGVRFQNGEPLTADTVKFSLERARSADSTNKDKAVFANIERITVTAPDALSLQLKESDPDLLFELGQNTAVIVEPKSAATNGSKPVGTGPFRLENWSKGSSITLVKWPDYREAAAIQIDKATFRFISDGAAQTAALLAGDLDYMPRAQVQRSLGQLRADKRLEVVIGESRGKGLLAINNGRKPLDNVLVRRAIAAAIDRKAFIQGALEGLGTPIGSHYAPSAPGYVDTTGLNPYDPDKARALLKEAGVALPLELSLKLPPPPYARLGGEIVAAQLAKVGINAKIENVEWAQWLSGVYRNKNYDLTVILHAEPLDIFHFAEPAYYWQYDSERFRVLYGKARTAAEPKERLRWMGDVQKMLAEDSVHAWMFAPQYPSVFKRGLKGVWTQMPIFAVDLGALRWE